MFFDIREKAKKAKIPSFRELCIYGPISLIPFVLILLIYVNFFGDPPFLLVVLLNLLTAIIFGRLLYRKSDKKSNILKTDEPEEDDPVIGNQWKRP